MTIALAPETVTHADVDALRDWLGTYPRLTKGEMTERFEHAWANWLGVRHAVFVNSGSSANLLSLAALMEMGALESGDKVGVPALSWATDLAPVMQLGLTPVLIDASISNLAADLETVDLENLKALIMVSVLGLPPDMDDVVKRCRDSGTVLIEDACEAMGSRCAGQLIGTFGTLSTFSLFWGHHLSTIEGGMVCTDDPALHRILLSLRSHGWTREWAGWNNSFDARYVFAYSGYNMRSTDLQAFIGLRQLARAEQVFDAREDIYKAYRGASAGMWRPQVPEDDFVSCFGYPLIVNDRAALVSVLEGAGVECRPLLGSHARQPFYQRRHGNNPMMVADYLHGHGLYLPCHHEITPEQATEVMETVVSMGEKVCA